MTKQVTKLPESRSRSAYSYGICIALVLTCLLLSARLAQAQQVPAETLRGLISQVVVGDRIHLVNKSGKTLEGKVEAMSATSLRLNASGKHLEFKESDIQEIGLKRPQHKRNGVLIGLAAGVAAGFALTAAECPNDPECSANAGPVFVLGLAGAGMGVGALVASSFPKYDAVFRAPAGATGLHVDISPKLSSKRKAVALTFRF